MWMFLKSCVKLASDKKQNTVASQCQRSFPAQLLHMHCFQYSLSVNCVAQAHVENLEGQVKEQEAYHNELQEVERWLLQMSSRMVTPDPSISGSLEAATQQLARHKVPK